MTGRVKKFSHFVAAACHTLAHTQGMIMVGVRGNKKTCVGDGKIAFWGKKLIGFLLVFILDIGSSIRLKCVMEFYLSIFLVLERKLSFIEP
jgi:hypothetical protein